MQYPKIQSLFKRDPDTNYKTFIAEYSIPEFGYLSRCNWQWKEKFDGTNIRIEVKDREVQLHGRTDRAQIPQGIIDWFNQFKTRWWVDTLNGNDGTIYGEGVGPGIQKGGENYGNTKKVVLFDVFSGNRWWQHHEIEDIAGVLDLDFAPVVTEADPGYAVGLVKNGIRSVAGDFLAEGLVGTPVGGMRRYNGERIITKIKTKDFSHPALEGQPESSGRTK